MRKHKPKPRVLQPDSRYNSTDITRFVNMMMYDGKKGTAFKCFYEAMDIVQEKMENENALDVWKRAIQNIMPHVEVKSRRVGGSTFQIPIEIRPDRRMSVAIKWTILYSRKRSGKGYANKLAAEIMAAAKGEGAAVKKREDTHRMAEANRAFAHFKV